MTKSDDIQTAINRASLMMTVDNDVAKAIQKAELHPAIAEVIMSLHHQCRSFDEELKAMRKNMLQMAQVIDASATYSTEIMNIVGDLKRRVTNESVNPDGEL